MDQPLSTLIVPTEKPLSTMEVKRALLLFDRVHILAPDDRELLPPPHFSQALWRSVGISLPIPFAISGGPVLPLGKVPGHDEIYDRTLAELSPAIDEGSVVIRPRVEMVQGIGNVPIPEGWAPPAAMFREFRRLASQADYLRDACRGLAPLKGLTDRQLADLAPGGGALTMSVVGGRKLPAIARLSDGSLPVELAQAIEVVAAARLGAAIKTLGICEVVGLHPFCVDEGMNAILQRVQDVASTTLASITSEDDETKIIQRARRVERILFTQKFSTEALDMMSVEEVLKLRTAAWGREGEARTAFFEAVRKLSKQADENEDFDAAVRAEIAAYEKATKDVRDQWQTVQIKAGECIVSPVAAVTGIGTVLQQLIALPSWELALVVAGVAALGALKAGPDLIKLRRQKEDSRVGAGRVLLAPFSGVPEQR